MISTEPRLEGICSSSEFRNKAGDHNGYGSVSANARIRRITHASPMLIMCRTHAPKKGRKILTKEKSRSDGDGEWTLVIGEKQGPQTGMGLLGLHGGLGLLDSSECLLQ